MFFKSVDDPKRGKVEKRLVTGGCDNLVKIWKMRCMLIDVKFLVLGFLIFSNCLLLILVYKMKYLERQMGSGRKKKN